MGRPVIGRKRIYAIVLAAGVSRRMGKSKQFLTFGSRPLLVWTIKSICQSRVDRIIVVANPKMNQVRELHFDRVLVVINKNYKKGISTSIRAGLSKCRSEARAVIFVLADQPFVHHALVDRIIEKYRRTKLPIVVPVYKSRIGNPVLFDRSMFRELFTLTGDVGAKSIIQNHSAELARVPVKSSQYFYDIDTPRQLKRANEMLAERH